MSERSKRINPLIGILESGKAAIGVWTAAYTAPRIAKVVATAGADFVVADVEHDVVDFGSMQKFLLQVNDFASRFSAERPPAVLVKLSHRAGWDPRQEIATMLKMGPAMGIWVPFVESRTDLLTVISAVRGSEGFAHAGLNLQAEKRDVWPLNEIGEYLVVAMIESERGVENAEEIVNTPGLGALEIVHMSDEATMHILDLCKRAGVVPAVTAAADEVEAKLHAGYRLISVGWDYALLEQNVQERVRHAREKMSN